MIGLPNGVYVLEFSTEPNTSVSRVFYYVTNLRVMAISKQQDHMRYIVVDAITGQPVKGAKVKVAGTNARAKENHVTLTTNEAGEVNYVLPKDYTRHTIYVYTSDDTACRYIGADDDFYFHDDKSRTEYTRIYTDRAIYRQDRKSMWLALSMRGRIISRPLSWREKR